MPFNLSVSDKSKKLYYFLVYYIMGNTHFNTMCSTDIFKLKYKKEAKKKQDIENITKIITADIYPADMPYNSEHIYPPDTYTMTDTINDKTDIKILNNIKEPITFEIKNVNEDVMDKKDILQNKDTITLKEFDINDHKPNIKEKHKKLIDNLIVIQNIKVGDKLCVTYDGILSIDNSYIPFITRTLYGNNKNVTIDAITQVIEKGKRYRKKYKYIDELFNSQLILGLVNLSNTYISCPVHKNILLLAESI